MSKLLFVHWSSAMLVWSRPHNPSLTLFAITNESDSLNTAFASNAKAGAVIQQTLKTMLVNIFMVLILQLKIPTAIILP